MMLRGMGFDNNTSIYLASGKIYRASRHLAPLIKMFPHVYTKDSLTTPDELEPLQVYFLFISHSKFTLSYIFSECN